MPTAQMHVVDVLTEAHATLKRLSPLGDGFSAATWHRQLLNDTAYSRPGHHTLSLYLAGGEKVRRRDQPDKWGAPGKLCLLPAEHESYWEIGGEIRFLHLYMPPELLARQIVQILDAEPRLFSLADRTYMDDAWLTASCLRLVQYDWSDPIARLSANALSHDVLLHLLQTQTQRVQLPAIKGGLSPVQRTTIRDWIETHLAENMTLSAMAGQLHLSEYHFAHMFKVSFGMPPHNWVLRRRIERAREQLQHTNDDLLAIALQNGFASVSHLSKHMKQLIGVPPGKYRNWSQTNALLPSRAE